VLFVGSSSATCFGIRLALRSGEAIGFPSHPIGIRKRSVTSAGWSQWVDATLALSLLAGVSKPKVFLGR
jgi:hypothetical protein